MRTTGPSAAPARGLTIMATSLPFQPHFSILGRCHLAALAVTAVYCLVAYPAAIIPIVVLLAAAVTSEGVPRAWKRWLAGEGILIVAGLATWWFLVRDHPDRIAGWLRVLITFWLLIPSRPGLLRWMVSLVLAEALLLGTGQVPVAEWRWGRNVFGDPGVLAQPLLGLLPLAIGSLALDAWATARLGGRSTVVPHAAWRFALFPSAVIVGGLWLFAPLTISHHHRLPPRLDTGPAQSGIRRPSISPGEHQWILRDPTPKARLLWEDPENPLFRSMVYLRAFTLPKVVVDGPLIRWEAEPLDQLRPRPNRFDPNKPFAWVVRLPMGNDALLRCEPGWGVDFEDILGDRHGNIYAPRLDDAPRAYRVNSDDAQPDDGPVEAYLTLPDAVRALPWDTLIDRSWRDLPALEAADRISAYLDARCTYDLEHLPVPDQQAAGMLQTFLWSPDAKNRRGHCQYFATAAALMLRYLNHPTRACAGYASNESDAEGYIFRGLHAHAWLEVRDEKGLWQRVDPTPPSFLAIRATQGPVPAEDAHAAPLPTQDWRTHIAKDGAQRRALSLLIPGLIVLGLGLVAVLMWWRRQLGRHPRTPADVVQQKLARQTAALEQLALELGIRITPATTLSELTQHLTARTGVDLQSHLQAHLVARYGGGPVPPPWPIEAVRRAGRAQGAVPPGKTSARISDPAKH